MIERIQNGFEWEKMKQKILVDFELAKGFFSKLPRQRDTVS